MFLAEQPLPCGNGYPKDPVTGGTSRGFDVTTRVIASDHTLILALLFFPCVRRLESDPAKVLRNFVHES